MDRLGVVEQVVTSTLLGGGGASVTEYRFLDWTVNGELLRTMLGWVNPPEESTCLVSGWDLDAALEWLDSLSRSDAGEFPDGRAAILVCQECGDLECGALSARITREAGTVRWAQFGWQVSREDGYQALDVALSLAFAEADYDELLRSLRRRLVANAVTVGLRGLRRGSVAQGTLVQL